MPVWFAWIFVVSFAAFVVGAALFVWGQMSGKSAIFYVGVAIFLLSLGGIAGLITHLYFQAQAAEIQTPR